MVVRSSAMAAAAGMTALVEEVADGTRVSLRPCGAGRWIGVAFLSFWLAGWACGEVFALVFLLGIAGAALGWVHASGLPAGAAGLGVALFLLVWLTLWTLGGVAALYTALRLAWGRDALTIGKECWTLWQGVGRWGRSHRLDPSNVFRLTVRPGRNTLIAETSGGSVTLTDLGSAQDRRWLLETLRQAAGLDAETGARPSAATRRRPGELDAPLSGYQVTVLRDGTTRLAMTARRRIGQSVGLLLLSLFWNGIVGAFVLAGLGVLPMKVEGPSGAAMAPGAWGYWLFLTPFVLVGLAMIAALIWTAVGREEWWAAPGQFTIRRFLLGNRWSWRYSAADLKLTVSVDSDGDESWRLVLNSGGKERKLDSGDPGRLRALGLLLAERTGWTLHDPTGR